jgi:hypothetical protein
MLMLVAREDVMIAIGTPNVRLLERGNTSVP